MICVLNLKARMSSAAAYTRLREEIPAAVRIIAVSKMQNLAAIQAVYGAGCRDFGENYLQEALDKIKAWPDPSVCWHFIGRIQSNKVKEIAQYFHVVHSVDRVSIAAKLNRVCESLGKTLPIFLQVNVDREPQKAGILPEDLPEVVCEVVRFPRLQLQGLMEIPAVGNRQAFAALRSLRDYVSSATGIALPHLSMGMSQDYEVAVSEGATEVRLGTVIFGYRAVAC